MNGHGKFEEIPVHTSEFLKAGEIRESFGPNGERVFLVGKGTDMYEVCFHLNLTAADRRFLKKLKIGVGDGIRPATTSD